MFGPIGITEIFLIFLIYGVPIILIAVSPRTRGSKKFGWILLSLFLSWLAYALFLIFTSKSGTKASI